VVVAVHAEPVPVDLATLAYAHQRIIGSGGYLPEDVITGLEITTARHAELERIVVLVVVGARFLPGGWNEV